VDADSSGPQFLETTNGIIVYSSRFNIGGLGHAYSVFQISRGPEPLAKSISKPQSLFYGEINGYAKAPTYDSGAQLSDAINFLAKNGAIEESLWPYKWGEFTNEPPAIVAKAKKYFITKTRKLDSATNIVLALNDGPVAVGISIFESLKAQRPRAPAWLRYLQQPIQFGVVMRSALLVMTIKDDFSNSKTHGGQTGETMAMAICPLITLTAMVVEILGLLNTSQIN